MTSPSTGVVEKTRLRLKNFSLPVWLVLICLVTFSVLLGAGAAISKYAPPQPATISSPQEEVLLTGEEIQNGQETYLGRGGQHIGSIWGHGSYLAPDWTADLLHRWGLATAGVIYANDPTFTQADLEALPEPERASLEARVKQQFKPNRYELEADRLLLTNAQTQGLQEVFRQYEDLLAQGSPEHSIPHGWFHNPQEIHDVTAFFTWTAWAASANRPHAPFSYTANWPHDDLVGNEAPGQFLVWSIVSVIVLIAVIGLFLYVYLRQEDAEEVQAVPKRPAMRWATPSQKATTLFFGVAMVLFGVQMGRRFL
jgi:nitric oxide reductase subunit B